VSIVEFLRDRYSEAREREQAKRRSIPSVFDAHDVEIVSDHEGERLIVDGHPYPMEKYVEIATEPAPDPAVLADLDAKLFLVEGCQRALAAADADPERPTAAPAVAVVGELLRRFAVPFAAHPDYDERWRP